MANAPIILTTTSTARVSSTYTLCHADRTGGYLLKPKEDRT